MGGGGNPGQQESQIAQQDQQGANQIAGEMSPLVQALTSGINMGNINSDVFGYLLNPNATNLAAQYPMLERFYHGLMLNGLDKSVVGNAFNDNKIQNQQYINSVKNSLGAGLPNLAGSVNDLGFDAIMGHAQLGSDLAAKNQQMKMAGAQGMTDLAGMKDQQKMGMLTAALAGGQGAYGSALSTYGNMFNNYLNSANQAAATAGQLQASQPNFWSSLFNAGMGAAELYGQFGGFSGPGGGQNAFAPSAALNGATGQLPTSPFSDIYGLWTPSSPYGAFTEAP